MTNKQKANEIVNAYKSCFKDIEYLMWSDMQDTVMEMADWKDKQFAKEKRQLFEKACDWLNSQACCGYIEDVKVDEFVEQFKKAIEG